MNSDFALHEYCRDKDITNLLRHLRDNDPRACKLDDRGFSALDHAVAARWTTGVHLLLSAGVVPSTWTLSHAILHCWCKDGEEILQRLLGASHQSRPVQNALLMSAIGEGNCRPLRIILLRLSCELSHHALLACLRKQLQECATIIAARMPAAEISTAVLMYVTESTSVSMTWDWSDTLDYDDCKMILPHFVPDTCSLNVLVAAIRRCSCIVRDLQTSTLAKLLGKSSVVDHEYRVRQRIRVFAWRQCARGQPVV